jgi:hypothetical protein
MLALKHSFKKGVESKTPYNPLIGDKTEIVYLNDEGNIPFIQCKMVLRGPEFMRKVGGLSFTFIDLYVPALTSCVNSAETSLQLSQIITFFAVCRIYTGVISKET